MKRLVSALALGLGALTIAAPVFAADYPDPFGSGADDNLRSSFPSEWDNSDKNDPLSFELGVRYWYSWGAQNFNIQSGLLTDEHGQMNESDQSQSVEGHFRIDDASTRFYAKGLGGMSFMTAGSSTDASGSTMVSNGHIGYFGADIGYSWIDNKSASFGPFAGYMYWNDSPNTYADNFTTAQSAADVTFDPVSGQTSFPGDSKPNDIALNMLRLGFSGKANLGPLFDVSAEVAAVPYAKVSGILGAGSGFASTPTAVNYDNQSGVGPIGPTGAFNVHDIQSSPTGIDGWGYGGMGELMVGFHPTDNLTFRFGGRAWYVQGTVDATYSRAQIGDPSDGNQPTPGTPADPTTTPPTPAGPPNLNPPNFDTPPTFSNQEYISRATPFSIFRYGILAEMTYSF